MRHKTYFTIVGVVFAFVALAHLARVLFGWDINISGTGLPAWVSLVAVLAIGYLAIKGFVLARQAKD